jgi:hypothetical protein
MSSGDAKRALTAHSSTPCDAVRSLEVSVRVRKPGVLVLDYALKADTSRLSIAPIRASVRADELWRHTCFEAFVRPAGSAGYFELNFSPSTQWAAYRFDSYRNGMAPAQQVGIPQISLDLSQGLLRLKAAVAIGELATLPDDALLQVGLSAVIEAETGGLSYWALRHAAGKPDFHHPDAFALEMQT